MVGEPYSPFTCGNISMKGRSSPLSRNRIDTEIRGLRSNKIIEMALASESSPAAGRDHPGDNVLRVFGRFERVRVERVRFRVGD